MLNRLIFPHFLEFPTPQSRQTSQGIPPCIPHYSIVTFTLVERFQFCAGGTIYHAVLGLWIKIKLCHTQKSGITCPKLVIA